MIAAVSRAHIVVGTLAALYVGVTVYDIMRDRERREQRPINPGVHAAFKQIDKACGAEQPQTATCRKALAAISACTADPGNVCAAEELHRDLAALDLKLPPLHR